MPFPYCFISEPPADNWHLTAAFAQMHVTAHNSSWADATVKAVCTSYDPTAPAGPDNPHKCPLPDVVLPHDPNVVYLLIYVMPHTSSSVVTHKLDVEMTAGGVAHTDAKSGILMDPPDDPNGGIHKRKEYIFPLEMKGKSVPDHDYLPKNLLEKYWEPDNAYLKAATGGTTNVKGKVAGGPRKLDVAVSMRDPHLSHGPLPATRVLFSADNLAANTEWAVPVDTPLARHGSVLQMEYKLDGRSVPVRFVLPIMDPAKKDTAASKPDRGLYVFKIAK